MERILLIGSGAREHAIARAIRGTEGIEFYAAMKNNNPGIRRLAQEVFLTDELDSRRIVSFAREKKIDLAVVGPEAPLEAGVSNALERAGIACASPSKRAAQIETNKLFLRSLMEEFDLPCQTPFRLFENANEARDFLSNKKTAVVKPLGLTGGKGVKILGETLKTSEEAAAYAREIIKKDGRVLIEEKLEGEEFTLQAFAAGTSLYGMPLVQDHKRAFDGDVGANTGGMGSYSDANHLLPFVSETERETALKAMWETLSALARKGMPYKGVLYGQFMLCKNGLRIIEFNARFGDPEAINVLSILETDFVNLLWKMVDGVTPTAIFARKATVVKYVVPAGYPESPQAGQEIVVEEKAFDDENTQLYYAAVNEENGKIFSTKSRALAINGVGATIDEAERRAREALEAVKGPIFFRKDIGTRALVQKRVAHMEKIRQAEKIL